MKQYVIWKGIASVEIPNSFQAATIGEKRKIFGKCQPEMQINFKNANRSI